MSLVHDHLSNISMTETPTYKLAQLLVPLIAPVTTKECLLLDQSMLIASSRTMGKIGYLYVLREAPP